MSDLAIGAVSGAGALIVAVLAVLVLGLKLSSAKDDNRDLAVENASLKAQQAVDAKTIADLSNDLKREQGVSDAVEDIASKPVPVGGAFDRLLSEGASATNAADSASGGGSGAVPAEGAPLSDRPESALERP